MRWETDADQLIDHLKMQVAHQIEAAIEGGGILGKYSTTKAERELDAAAKAVFRKPVSPLTKQIAEEIAEKNRKVSS